MGGVGGRMQSIQRQLFIWSPQARSQNRIWKTPPKVDLVDPKSGLFEAHPSNKTPIFGPLCGHKWTFASFGGCIAPPPPPLLATGLGPPIEDLAPPKKTFHLTYFIFQSLSTPPSHTSLLNQRTLYWPHCWLYETQMIMMFWWNKQYCNFLLKNCSIG